MRFLIPAISHKTSCQTIPPWPVPQSGLNIVYDLVLKQSSLGVIRLLIYPYGWKMIKSYTSLVCELLMRTFVWLSLWPELGLSLAGIMAAKANRYFRYYKIIDKEQKLLLLHMLGKCFDKSQVTFQLRAVLAMRELHVSVFSGRN